MKFFRYDTRENLIWTSGKGNINANKTNRQGIPKTHMNMVSLS